MNLNIKLDENAKIPEYGSEYAAGIDLFSSNTEDIIIPAKNRKLISTGLYISWDDPKYYMRIAPRSGLSVKNCIDVGAGVIDYDYRGELKILLINNSNDKEFIVSKNMKIAQMIPTKMTRLNLNITDTLEETVRGIGGFGSTGV
jgi:dUTP pyrophosphatase